MDELTDKQKKFIDTYLKSKSITDTCKKLNIARSTAYGYLRDTNVKSELDKRRMELINDTTIYLQGSLQECCKTLMEIIKNDENSPQIKINAINSIFNNCNKLTETNDILTKIAEIEERLNEREEDIT